MPRGDARQGAKNPDMRWAASLTPEVMGEGAFKVAVNLDAAEENAAECHPQP